MIPTPTKTPTAPARTPTVAVRNFHRLRPRVVSHPSRPIKLNREVRMTPPVALLDRPTPALLPGHTIMTLPRDHLLQVGMINGHLLRRVIASLRR